MPPAKQFPQRKTVAKAVLACMFVLGGCAAPPPLKTMQKPLELDPSVIGLTPDDGPESLAVEAEAAFTLRDVEESDPLPPIQVPKLNFTERSVGDVLRMILKDTDISLSIQGSPTGTDEAYGGTTVYNLQGSLGEVLERMSRQVGFVYTYRDKVLTIRPDRQYLITLPPAVSEDTYAGITNNIIALGAQAHYLDRLGKTLMFRANRTAASRIEDYVNFMRSNRQLIVYDVMIYSVELNDNFSAGVNWGAIASTSRTGQTPTRPLLTTTPNRASGVTTFDALTTNPAGISTTFLLSRFNTGVLLSLLSSYGQIKKLSQPRIAILSGGSGHFRQGRNTTYVSKVGNNFSTSINSVTVDTASLTTGITLRMSGDVTGGAVHTRISLKIQEVLGYNDFTALGTQLRLPDTADRELGTEILAPIGTSAVLGGIVVQNDDKTVRGLPGPGGGVSLPLLNSTSSNTAELVFIVSPRVYRFDKVKPQVASAAEAPAVAPVPATPAGEPAKAPPPPAIPPSSHVPSDKGRALAEKLNEYQPVVAPIQPRPAPVAATAGGQDRHPPRVKIVPAATAPKRLETVAIVRPAPAEESHRSVSGRVSGDVMRDRALEVW